MKRLFVIWKKEIIKFKFPVNNHSYFEISNTFFKALKLKRHRGRLLEEIWFVVSWCVFTFNL